MPYKGSGVQCGTYGHTKKDGSPCRYIVYPPAKACLHHAADKTKQREVLERARRASKEASLPAIDCNNFETIQDCLTVRAAVVKELTTKPRPNYRALDMILKACTGASADHGVKAAEKTNELLLALSGHGAGLQMLERLRTAKLRVLPGKRGPALEVIPASDKPEPSNTPTEPEEASNAD